MGSSPLARGLLGASPLARGIRGIIPARAGFTIPSFSGRFFTTDHPRSRGVYLPDGGGGRGGEGSSPLARGLPLRRPSRHAPPGIIPARAGFTRRPTWRPGPPPDHPRSRGVYNWTDSQTTNELGSSPLARGLRLGSVFGSGVQGIIPARAGFTWSSSTPPRSTPGSSPLARGLQLSPQQYLMNNRIIPARAGFTSERMTGARGTGDHPRSRGVYPARCGGERVLDGSSPLARGLHEPGGDVGAVGRIIPARAGFTRRRAQSLTPTSDHPRSRGVYSPPTGWRGDPPGSSPLARGLPPRPTSPSLAKGIIPARAGFTNGYGWQSDIPMGSSPLARGLPAPRRLGALPGRIIPARAGFTHPCQASQPTRPDHPRSRGVYVSPGTRIVNALGSSPLARGLQRPLAGLLERRRIIPARAGFTSPCGR